MGDWYTVGILAGVGAALGIAAVAALRSMVPAAALAIGAAVGIGFAFGQLDEALGGLAGAACGTLGGFPLVSGALRRGGTRGGTAIILAGAALVVAALAFVPAVGYLEAVAALLLGLRVRGGTPERHAGLRTLAKD